MSELGSIEQCNNTGFDLEKAIASVESQLFQHFGKTASADPTRIVELPLRA